MLIFRLSRSCMWMHVLSLQQQGCTGQERDNKESILDGTMAYGALAWIYA